MKLRNVLDNRKTQGLSVTTMILLASGVVLLVIIVLAITGVWGSIAVKLNLLPSNLEAAAQSCELSADAQLKTSYCNEFKKVRIAGKKQYINCEELTAYTEFELWDDPGCDDTVGELANQTCHNEELGDDFLINGEKCSEWNLNLSLSLV